MLKSDDLKNILFPLGEITKPEVRQIAARLGLKTAFKKDSQDICFVGKKDYRMHYYYYKRAEYIVSDPGRLPVLFCCLGRIRRNFFGINDGNFSANCAIDKVGGLRKDHHG